MVDINNTEASKEAITRNLLDFDKETGNVYETIAVLAKRANQISSELKTDLNEKIADFNNALSDNLDEVYENREQIEIAKFYENLPKATLLATEELLDGKIYFREPEQES